MNFGAKLSDNLIFKVTDKGSLGSWASLLIYSMLFQGSTQNWCAFLKAKTIWGEIFKYFGLAVSLVL